MLNYNWILEGRLLAMSLPRGGDLPKIRALGVGAVLSTSGHFPPELTQEGMSHLHLPVRDFHPPSQDQLHRAVAFVDEALGNGVAVAVHCLGGYGRTGTFVAAFLVHRGATDREAIREVRRRRSGSIETSAQEDAVAIFARHLRSEGGTP